MNKISFLLLLTICLISCSHDPSTSITGKIQGASEGTLLIGSETVHLQDDGTFVYTISLEYPLFLTLSYKGSDWELYIAPGSVLELMISDSTSIQFNGALANENLLLLNDKKLNDTVSSYLGKNWYQLHRLGEAAYLANIDSLKMLYFSSLEESGLQLTEDFVTLSTASINYSFDRMILRYPQQHANFTGSGIELSEQALEYISSSKLDAPEYEALTYYQDFVRSKLDLEISLISSRDNSQKHSGLKNLESALKVISEAFETQSLIDYWTFEYLKRHIEKYTWINGERYIKKFQTECQSEDIIQQLDQLIQVNLIERADHAIYVYSAIAEFQLEAHIFYPKDFDKTKSYPAVASFHGGGWADGNASWTFNGARHFAENGLVGVAVEYRLSNGKDVCPIDAMQDTRELIRWLRIHSDSLRIDPNRIAAKGISAGGQLVLSTTILPDTLEANVSSKPNVVILISPAINVHDDYFKSLINGRELNAIQLSPIENITSGMELPPTLILQGRTDRVTPTVFAEAFKNKMDSLGYPCELAIYENCGHLFTPSYLDDTSWPQPDPEISRRASERADEFLVDLGYILSTPDTATVIETSVHKGNN